MEKNLKSILKKQRNSYLLSIKQSTRCTANKPNKALSADAKGRAAEAQTFGGDNNCQSHQNDLFVFDMFARTIIREGKIRWWKP